MEKPFIKLFHTPNSGYFYDVGKNEIIRIPENVYQHLTCVDKGTAELEHPDDKAVFEMIESFKEMGYLSTRRPKRIQHTATAMVPLLLERCIDKVTLQLTQDCNFRCKYCIYSEEKNIRQRSHANKSMSLETAKKAILFYRDHAVDANMYNVGFYGGEPLLQWDLLKEIVLFSEKELAGKLLMFSLTTNASLITETMAAFLEKHNINIVISLDGLKHVNDSNRIFQDGTGTFDTVLQTIRMIKMNFPILYKRLGISSVITPRMDISAFGLFPDELNDLPPSCYMSGIEDSTDHVVVIPLGLYNKMENEAFHAYLSHIGLFPHSLTPYGYGQVEKIHNAIKAMQSTDGIQDIMAPGGPCVPGKGRLFVSVDGFLYPCERINETDTYCIGDLDTGFNYIKAQDILNIGSITEDKCKNCWAMRHCTICGKSFDYKQSNATEEKMKLCHSVKQNAYNKIRGIILFYELDTYYKMLRN